MAFNTEVYLYQTPDGTTTIHSTWEAFEIWHKPRGRICRLGPSDAFTGLQRGIVIALTLGWLTDSQAADALRTKAALT